MSDGIVDDVRLEFDSDGVVESWTLAIDDAFGTHRFEVDPQMVEDALRPWRVTEAQAHSVRVERQMAGETWDPFVSAAEAFSCVSPEDEWVEMLREQGDALKARRRGEAA